MMCSTSTTSCSELLKSDSLLIDLHVIVTEGTECLSMDQYKLRCLVVPLAQDIVPQENDCSNPGYQP